MVVISKLKPIEATCIEYVHPWTNSCPHASAELFIQALQRSFKIYATAYTAALIMRGKVPSQNDLVHTIKGIIQSTAFLTTNGFTYSMFLCSLRRLMGNFNFLTVSFVPSFLASFAAILIERPSRRNLLALYVSNEATETLWNMAVSRGWVSSWKHGSVAIFSCSVAVLLYHYRANTHLKKDSLASVARFVIGRHEEFGYISPPKSQSSPKPESTSTKYKSNSFFALLNKAVMIYRQLIIQFKSLGKTEMCYHPNSCAYNTMKSCLKLFSLGVGAQVLLKIFMQLFTLVRKPSLFKKIVLNKSSLGLGMFVGGFAGIYSATSCLMRLLRGYDDPLNALPAGLLAGLAFSKYRSNSIALYVMWKMFQISYDAGVSKGVLPAVPWFTILLYCTSTATLFHAATIEPTNLRPSYWKFLHGLSGGRIARMARPPMDVWGLQTSQLLQEVLKRTNTTLEITRFL